MAERSTDLPWKLVGVFAAICATLTGMLWSGINREIREYRDAVEQRLHLLEQSREQGSVERAEIKTNLMYVVKTIEELRVQSSRQTELHERMNRLVRDPKPALPGFSRQ